MTAADPGLYAPLTSTELDVLAAYLHSGWRMLSAAGGPGCDEASAVLDDIYAAFTAALSAEFDPWHVWRADSGRFWATRPVSDFGAGSGETVDAYSGEGMHVLLAARSRP